jgi:hypothetical protein
MWGEDMMARITERMAALRLTTCPICREGMLEPRPEPVVLFIGGLAWLDQPGIDLGSDLRFMVAVACDVCGHTTLFDSEKFGDGDVRSLEAE